MGESPGPGVLPVREAYRLWSERYGEETAVTALEEVAVKELSPAAPGVALLDAGCGTARRLAALAKETPRTVVGVDLVYSMLANARRRHGRTLLLAAADVRILPFARNTFDVIWCRLVLGHVQNLRPAYAELHRVGRPGASVVVTDFHAEALSSDHARTFRDAQGTLHAVETHLHTQADHESSAREAGLSLESWKEWCVGSEVRRFYEKAGALDRYQRQSGLPLLLALRFIK